MTRWLRQHVRVFASTLGKWGANPVSVLLNVAVIGVAISLPAAGYVLLGNLDALASRVAGQPQLTVFLTPDAPGEEVSAAQRRLARHGKIRSFRFVPKDEALKDLKHSVGLADVASVLSKNPLPDAFIVNARVADPDALETLRSELTQWPRVEHVQLDSAWARRLDALLKVGRLALLVLAALLGTALVTVTFNTIRLQILTQREEIEVSKLIGATDGFIRRPFLYYGALLGLAGGMTAWGIVALAAYLLNGPVGELSALYGTRLQLASLTLQDTGVLLLGAAGLGWVGAGLSVARHLRDIEPR